MERIKLSVPDKDPIFKTNLIVQVGDLNYGNHVGNDRMLLYAHEARQRFLKSINQSELKFLNNSLIMADSICVYKSQAYWSDEIEAYIYLNGFKETAFSLFYDLRNIKTNQSIVHITTTMVFFDYEKDKVAKVDISELEKLFDIN